MQTSHFIIVGLSLMVIYLLYVSCQTPLTVVKKVKGDCPACNSCCDTPAPSQDSSNTNKDSNNSGNSGKHTVYGTTWCGFTVKQLDYLKSKNADFVFVDCEKEQCLPDMQGFPVTITADGERVDGYREFLN